MGAIFQSLGRTVLAGVVILVVMIGVAGAHNMMGTEAYWAFFMRWLHILSGVMSCRRRRCRKFPTSRSRRSAR
jgi:hypothetical protein